MPTRRISLVLCFILLLASCKTAGKIAANVAEHIDAAEVLKSIYDVYPYVVPPALTAIAKEQQPAPTLGTLDPIRDYFKFASVSSCRGIPYKGGDNAPWQSTVCGQSDNTAVRFDSWFTSIAMDAYLKPILDTQGTRVTRGTWYDGNHPDETLGMLYEFIDGDGHANLIWTVTNKQLSGWALRLDNDQKALKSWWAETAYKHN